MGQLPVRNASFSHFEFRLIVNWKFVFLKNKNYALIKPTKALNLAQLYA
jgi:hypothetical protein